MDPNEIIKLIAPNGRDEKLSQLNKIRTTTKLSIAKTKLVIESLKKSIQTEQEKEAIDWALVGFILSDDFIRQARRMGAFRASKYDYKTNTLKPIMEMLRSISKQNSEFSVHNDYLSSLSNMHIIADSVRDQLEIVRAILATKKELSIKGMLITLDFIFMQRANRDLSDDSKDDEFFSIEDMAEAFSLLFYQYHARQGQPNINYFVPADTVLDGEYLRLLMNGAHIRSFQEFEIMIDTMNFLLQQTGIDKCFDLVPPSPILEKSIRLGYISSEMQRYISYDSINEKSEQIDKASLTWMAKKLYEATAGSPLIRHHRAPTERFVYSIPKYDKLTDYIKGDWLATEELFELKLASRELMMPMKDLLRFKIYKDVAFFDIVKAQRFLNLLRLWICEHQQPQIETNLNIVLQSLIPHFKSSAIQELLEKVIEKNIAEQVLELLAWDPSQIDLVMDIQYQPMIKLGDGYWMPLNIIGNSNLIRNSFVVCKTRLFADGKRNPIGTMLLERFRKHTEHVAIDVKYKFSSIQGDIDFIALIDKYLFVFECKNSLIPCNMHELRTSFDYINDGAEQLDKFSALFSGNIEFQKYLASRLKLKNDFSEDIKIVSCIVTGNRIFSGYRVGKHAVRQLFELANVVDEGRVPINSVEYSLWQEDRFHAADLVRYIEQDFLHSLFFAAMSSSIRKYNFRDLEVSYKTFKLDILDLAGRLTCLKPFHRSTEAK